MERTNVILIVEDDVDRRQSIKARLEELSQEMDVDVVDEAFTEDVFETASSKGIALEEAIKEKFDDKGSIRLLVVDHDLTKLGAISESTFTAAAHMSAIPVCRYHRRPNVDTPSNWELNSSVFAVDVHPGTDFDLAFAEGLFEVYTGFLTIAEEYTKLPADLIHRGPASILAEILGMPGLVSHFSQYTSGVAFLNDPLNFSANIANRNSRRVDLKKRIPYVLGYWLHNSILRFPGIILNQTATESYLNIDTNDFVLSISCFDDARYRGPFSSTQKYWWREKLDHLIREHDYDLGAFLNAKGFGSDIKACVCSQNHESPAGYYDILRKLPISLDASIELSWIPDGADLTRANKEMYDEFAPLLGI